MLSIIFEYPFVINEHREVSLIFKTRILKSIGQSLFITNEMHIYVLSFFFPKELWGVGRKFTLAHRASRQKQILLLLLASVSKVHHKIVQYAPSNKMPKLNHIYTCIHT